MPADKWKTDPMMDVVDKFELTYSGVFPIASDRRWHCGMHLVPDCGLGQKEPVRAIADGEVMAYRVAQNAVSDGQKKSDGTDAGLLRRLSRSFTNNYRLCAADSLACSPYIFPCRVSLMPNLSFLPRGKNRTMAHALNRFQTV
ncbi:hypothetical protein [Caballeronia sp. GAWG1-1]|uniref:hypothetical protein n=1 Tax=Caballeronia sp. GAWG1-1 TaxID=2921742 RepID=UPI0032EC59AA